MATFFGVALPSRFTTVEAEYRAARESVAVIDTNFRAVFSLSGPDRVRYLNAVTTNDLRNLAPGQTALGLLLNAQGHILAELETLALEDRLLILAHKLNRERAFETLDKFIIMDDATLADETAATGTLALEGPAALQLLQDLAGLDLAALAPRNHAAAVITTPSGAIACCILHRSLTGVGGAEVIAPISALPALWSALVDAARKLGGAPIGYQALNSLRLEAGIRWFGADFGEREIPNEAGIEATHLSFTKGCYTGQEIVERVRSRGHVNRKLTGLAFDSGVPAPGSALTADGAEAGSVTSAVFSPRAGHAIGFGYVRREHNRLGQRLQCGVLGAEVIELPLCDTSTKK